MKIAGIYAIINLYNGKVYVGSAIYIKGRWTNHLYLLGKNIHFNKHLQYAYNKYWINPFIFTVLEYCDKHKLLWREQFWIDELNVCNPDIGYNLKPTAGSNLGFKASQETRAKMSAWQVGRVMSDEAKANMSKRAKGNKNASGYKHTPEALAIMSAKRKGCKHTEEHKRKISVLSKGNKSHLGRTFSEKHKQNLSISKKRYLDSRFDPTKVITIHAT